MGLAIVLFLTLLVSHTFYWAQSELLQAIVLVLFFYGVVMKLMPLKGWHLIILTPLTPVIIFLHPLIFIPFLFLWLFILLSNKFPKNIWYYAIFVIFVITLFVKHFWIPTGAYDNKSYGNADGIFSRLFDVFGKKSSRDFLHYCLTDYFFILPLFVFINYYYIKYKNWLKLVLFLSFFLGYFELINLSYHWGISQFHVESFYRVFVVFLVIPLIFDIWDDLKYRKVLLYLIPFMVFVRLINITARHDIYTARVEWNKELLQKVSSFEERKFVLLEKDAPENRPLISWATPYVTSFLSTLENPDSTVTVLLVSENNKNYQEHLSEQKLFLGPWGPLLIPRFKQNYFHFDTTGIYRVLKKEDLKYDTMMK
ncbi:MAG: hypothetical protein KDC85_24175 [Saprospiraceae bacterium]|nr:hypothetical protein [Saprospiraceae bacterium]MCB9323677.1 hypothetical protein [Lewinellaceae bacterium]